MPDNGIQFSHEQLSVLPTAQLRAILIEEQTRINAMRDQISASEQKINMIKTVLSPFTRLPQELISEIFRFYCDAQGIVYDEFQKRNSRTRPSKIEPDRVISGIDTIPPQLILTQVSKFWRDVAHQTRPIWTDLTMYIQTGKFSHHQELIEEWLERSGLQPVDIHIVVPKGKGQATRNLLEAIIPFSVRWRRLKLSAPLQTLRPFYSHELLSQTGFFNAPLLEHVRMDVCQITETSLRVYDQIEREAFSKERFPTFDGSPNLISFDGKIAFEEYESQPYIFSFMDFIPPQISHVGLDGDAFVPLGVITLDHYKQSLTSLSVTIPAGFEQEPHPMIFPNLRSISLTTDGAFEVSPFLQQLTTPSLQSLKLTTLTPASYGGINTDTFQELMNLQMRSSFVLEELKVYDCVGHGHKFLDFLISVPSLKRLTVYESNTFSLRSFFPWLAYDGDGNQPNPAGGLPNLTELRLYGGKTKKETANDEPFEGILEIISERCVLPDLPLVRPGRCLRVLEMQMTEAQFEGMDADEVERISDIIELGFKACFKLWQPDGTFRYTGSTDVASK